MRSIFFLEFREDIHYLKKILKLNNKLIIISCNQASSLELYKNNITHIKLYSFFNNQFNYNKHYKKVDNLIQIVKSDFFSVYKNFQKFEWYVLNDFFHQIKICYDQLYFYSYCLDKIIKKYKPQQIFIRENKELNITNEFLFNSNQSILYLLIKENNISKITIIKNIENKVENKKIENKIYFNIKENIIIFLNYLKFFFSTKKIISYDNIELDEYIKNNKTDRKFFLSLKNELSFKVMNKSKAFRFKKRLKENNILKRNLMIKNFDISSFFYKQLFYISLTFEHIFEKFLKYLKIFSKKKIKLIIFNQTSPNIIFFVLKQICKLNKIKNVMWAHGGYCSLSCAGYDSTDLRLFKNHFSYGPFFKDLINNKNFNPSKINKIKYETTSIGSPKILNEFNNSNFFKHSSKKIIVMTGAVERYNKNYFPNTRSNYFKTYSPFIIRVLKKIQKYKKYEIILKDYPNSPDKQFWKSVIEYYKLTKVKYISNEISMNNLINNNQLIISPWLSTTFFQSLPYKNKILILDKTHFSPLQKKLDKDLNFFKSEKSLLNYLDNFLPLFNNYKFRFHKKSIKYFLNGNNHKIHKFNIHQELKKFLSFDYN